MLVISVQSTVEISVTALNHRKKMLKHFIFDVHDRSLSSMLVPPESSSAVQATSLCLSATIFTFGCKCDDDLSLLLPV